MNQRLLRFLRNVGAIAYKEASQMRHDSTLIGNVLGQPLMMLCVFGYAMSFHPRHVPWAVLDRSETPASRQLIAQIESVGSFDPPMRVVGYADGRRLLERSKAVAVVVIPHDFRRRVEEGRGSVQLLLDGTDPLTAARVARYITEVAAQLEIRATPKARSRETPPGGRNVAQTPIDLRQEFRFNPTLLDRNFYLSALAGFLLMNIGLSGGSLGLVAEKENGTYEQMLAQPTTAIEIVLGKLVPNVVIGYVALAVAVVGAGLAYGYWPAGSVLLLAVVTLPFLLSVLGLGVLVSALARTSAQAVFISVFFIMPSFVLSGSMLPYQLMPHGVREIGGLFPLRWYQIASRRIIERGADPSDVALPTLVLFLLFGATLLALRWRIKPRLG
jgi:ABC-2 type transport system permease protein